jgi:hypothetical protein
MAMGAAQEQLQGQHVEQAQTLARQAAALEPDSPQVKQLLDRIGAAREQAVAAHARATERLEREPSLRAQIEEQLDYAHVLMQQGHLVEPPRDNALAVLRLAHELAPGDPRIGQAHRDLMGLLVVEARRTLALGHPEEAVPLIVTATELGARPDEIDELTRQAQRERAPQGSDALDRVTSIFNERLQQGRLLEPASDSAKFYLGQLISRDPASPATQVARAALAARLLAQAQGAMAQQDFAAARGWIAEAREAGADTATLAAAEADLQSAVRAPASLPPPGSTAAEP